MSALTGRQWNWARGSEALREGRRVRLHHRPSVRTGQGSRRDWKRCGCDSGGRCNLDDLDKLYAEVAAKKGKIDVRFANAGLVEMVPTADVTPEHFDKTFNIARGVFFTVQRALSHLNDGASIVITGSGVRVKGYPAYGTYAATKAALRSFVRTWTTELKDRHIRVNILSPGAIETPIIDGQFESKEAADGAREYFASITPLGRMGRPEEIAAAALFLASDESSYIAGIDRHYSGLSFSRIA